MSRLQQRKTIYVTFLNGSGTELDVTQLLPLSARRQLALDMSKCSEIKETCYNGTYYVAGTFAGEMS